MKNTPEPWSKEDFQRFPFTDITQRGLQIEDFARSVACVNACAGMDDPAADIERLRAESEALKVLKDNAMDLLSKGLDPRITKDANFRLEVTEAARKVFNYLWLDKKGTNP